MSKAKRSPAKQPSAKQLAARAAFAERNRTRGKANAPEPAIAVGDRVRVRPTPEHPVSQRGRVTDVKGDVITAVVGGYPIRFREHQLERVP
jgi:hypothetical protein